MKAVVFHGVGDIRFEPNWPDPPALGRNEVKISTSWSGICGTDLHDYERGGIISVDKPHPVTGRMAPLVLGHEFSGRVAEIGPDVEGLEVGQRVAVESIRGCQKCYWCQRHRYAQCQHLISVGQQDDGGMAEYFNIPAENCIPIPDSLGEDVAAVAEPLAIMIRAARKGNMQIGETVTVVGAGAIGLCGIAVARAAGAQKVIAITHGGKRAEVAEQMGAHYVLNSTEQGWEKHYDDITDGRKAELVFDTGGTVRAMRLAVELTARGGRCVFVSLPDEDILVSCMDIVLNEKEIIGSVGHTHEEEFPWAVQYIADGRIDVAPLITSRICLEDAVEKGFKKLRQDRNEIKILVTPHRDPAQ